MSTKISNRDLGGWGIGNTHWLPLLLGLDSSLSQPVYSIVTVWPTLGTAPEPSCEVVLVTPILAKLVEKVLAELVASLEMFFMKLEFVLLGSLL